MGSENTLDLTTDLKDLFHLALSEDAVDQLLRRGLDALARVAPYDLATLFELHGDALVNRVARGRLADERVRRHKLRLADFPSIQEAIDLRRARAFTGDDHAHGDGDPFDGVLDLPHGHSCMVVPLCAGPKVYGVITLDRSVCEPYLQETVSLVEVYAQILAIALQNTEEKIALGRLHAQDHEHAKDLEAELGGDAIPLLESDATPAMRSLVARAKQVAQTDTPVLILGETGTGKGRLAHALHQWSPRRDQPIVALNCAAVPANLLESELFGHVKGAFTGATKDRSGRFRMANGGTLFLDEVGELPVELQAKLLQVLQDGTFTPVGSDRQVKVDVRIVAATNVDLETAIAEKRFREDLYYRLQVFPLTLPPLRERLGALPQASRILLSEQARRTGRHGMQLSTGALDALKRHAWPGNLRELANVLERATILCRGPLIGPEHIDLAGPNPAKRRRANEGPTRLEDVEREHIRSILARTHGRIYGDGGAAELLGLKPSTLQSRMKKLGIRRRLRS